MDKDNRGYLKSIVEKLARRGREAPGKLLDRLRENDTRIESAERRIVMMRLFRIQTVCLPGDGGGGVDNLRLVFHNLLDGILQERVVGAAQYDVVGTFGKHRLDVAAQQGFHLR